MQHPAVAMLSCIAVGMVGLVLARAAVHKLISHEEFRIQLAEYQLFPRRWAAAASVALTAAEVTAVIALLLPASRVAGTTLAALLFLVYSLAMVLNLLRGRNSIECGCGAPGQYLSWFLVSRNIGLAMLCLLIPTAGDLQGLSGPEAIAAAASTLVLWLALVLADRVLGNHSHLRATSRLDHY